MFSLGPFIDSESSLDEQPETLSRFSLDSTLQVQPGFKCKCSAQNRLYVYTFSLDSGSDVQPGNLYRFSLDSILNVQPRTLYGLSLDSGLDVQPEPFIAPA